MFLASHASDAGSNPAGTASNNRGLRRFRNPLNFLGEISLSAIPTGIEKRLYRIPGFAWNYKQDETKEPGK